MATQEQTGSSRTFVAASLSSMLAALFIGGGLSYCALLPAENEKPQTADSQETSGNASGVAPSEPQQPNSAPETCGATNKTCRVCHWAWTNGPADYALVVLGWGGILAAIYTLKEVQRQSHIAEMAANAARISADAELLSQRAWIKVVDVHLGNISANQIPVATVVYKNVGHTPANLRVVRLKLETMKNTDSLATVPNYEDLGLAAPTTLMPDEEASSIMDYTQGPNRPLSEFIANAIASGDAHIYVYGCVEYTDVLEPLKPRITRFARRYDAALSAQAKKTIFVFPKVPGYNEAT